MARHVIFICQCGIFGRILNFFCGLILISLLASTAQAQQFKISLGWFDNSANEDGFRIERKLGQGGSYSSLATVGPNTEAYDDAAVNSGVTYCYRVKAFNAAGESGYTNEVCSMPNAASSPSPSPTTSTSTSVSSGSAEPAVAAAATGGSGGCFIATAAFGSPMAPQVQLLREIRDKYLLASLPGRFAVHAYYATSPPIADVISRSETLRAMTRLGLMPLLGWASLALWSPLVGVVIPAFPILAGAWLIGRRSRSR